MQNGPDPNPVETDATGLAASLRARDLSAVEALQAYFARVDAVNPAVNAVVWQGRDAALERAKMLDAAAAKGRFHGPLHGVPVTLKEAFDVAGSPSTRGNPALKDNIAAVHSDVAARYESAGAVIFGKTNVPLNLVDWQSFNAVYGTTNNPWDVTRGPGGSSGGSAAALASGMSALEAGSDIGSSIRNPAHYCGVFGLKPTWGVISSQGHALPGNLSDCDIGVVGPMARSARDLSLAFGVLVGPDVFQAPAWDVACPPDGRKALSQFRVALKLGDANAPVDRAYTDRLHAFADRLAKAGATVKEVEPDIDTAAHFRNYRLLLGAALSAGVSAQTVAAERAEMEATAGPLACELMGARLEGRGMRHADWLVQDNIRRHSRRVFDAFFNDWDILLTPVCVSAAFEHNQRGQRYTRMLTVNGKEQPEIMQLFWSGYSGVVGLPSVVGPMDFVGHLPVGYQAIAGYGRDHTALAFATAVEREIRGFQAPDLSFV